MIFLANVNCKKVDDLGKGKAFMWITTNYAKFIKRWEYQPPYLSPEKPVCKSRNNRNGHGKIDWFKIEKEVHKDCILSPCLFNPYAEFIM